MSTTTAPWIRVSILILATAVLGTISHRFTGHVLPADPKDALVFQNALLLIVLGSAFLERHYTKPADSLVNSLMGLITLLSVRAQAPTLPWQIVAGYCTLVFLLSSTCVAVSSGSNQSGWKAAVASFTYRPSVVLGRARLLFTIVFLSGLWFFYSVQSPITLALVIFWGVFLAIWPLKIPELLTSWFHGEAPPGAVSGEIVRIGNPNIVRTRLDGEADWSHEELKICCLPNGKSYWLRPLFSQFQEGTLLATGLLTDIEVDRPATNKNRIIDASESFLRPSDDQVNEALGGGTGSKLVGFIAEGSTIASVRFETLDPECCHDGLLVWAEVAKKRVYYQIVAGETREESFASDKHGYQVASATQLGTLSEKHGFSKFEWLPAMNTPIFSTADATTVDFPSLTEGDFELGVIPKTNIKVGGAFAADYNHHTAILGITGSGKTELAFDLIRNALKNDIKVICIDLTAQYENRLDDLAPQDLSITEEVAEDLAEKLFEVETGTFGAPNEKNALNEFATQLRDDISSSISEFLSDGDASNLGIIRLEEISNTKATLWITELYMTCLLKYARENRAECPEILIVVEEAHTVMPEPATMGLGDFDSKGLVGKIAQIALQGRKYGVGLLVLAQRTATVSKSVLTQCNTIISFNRYDDTSLGFLRNIYGSEHVALIPNLPPLHAVAFGKWVRSERPIVFEVPFDDAKAATGS